MKSKKRLIKIFILIIVIACSAIFIPWKIIALWVTPLPDTIQVQVDDAIKQDLDGIIVYVDGHGKEAGFYTAGWKDRVSKVPANPHSLFKIASISKLYIAAAAAKMVSSRILLLDKTLASYLPELAGRIENADLITLRMMLQHRSGIPDFIDVPNMPWSNLPVNSNAFLQLIIGKSADFNPDSRYRYSNTNYLLIGSIMDKVLGYSHREYIKREILRPLKLIHTYNLLSEVDMSEMMSGYYIKYNGDLKTQNFVVPGGSMVATISDVGVFLRALNDGSVLNNNEQTIYSALYQYEHTGLLPGYSSIARYYKDIDRVVIQFVNTSGGDSWTTSEIIYNRIVKILQKQSLRK